MLPSFLANAISTVLQIAASTAKAQAASEAPAPAALLSAASSLAAFLKASYPDPGLALLPYPLWWWQSGSAIDALLHYAFVTGDQQYLSLLQTTVLSQATPGNDFMTPDATGNDDQAWWALAAMTAAESNIPPPGPVPWIDLARNVFHEQSARWGGEACNGGLRWKIASGDDGFHYKNAISNGLLFQLSARIAALTKDPETLVWAEKIYNWSTGVGLVDEEFNVYDGTDENNGCSDLNHDQWSYNVGVFLYGSAVLASHTKEKKWVDRTRGFVASAKRSFTNPKTGALWEKQCEGDGTCNTDQISFKGVLARSLGAAAEMLPEVREDVSGIVNGAAKAVLKGPLMGLGALDAFNALEVVDASLRAQGLGGAQGMIGPASRRSRRSVAGRIVW
jgi:mannan endo-1,6-alpha-mannosidase